MVAERIRESEFYMATSRFGFTYHPAEWSVADDKAVENALYSLRSKRDPSNHGRLEEWSQYDEYLSLAVRLRVEAKRVSSEREDLELGQVWNILKRRMLQKIQGNVIDGMFEISNHYKTEIRKIWALAELEEQSAEQLSLFDESEYDEGTSLSLVETIEDTTSHGSDPQEVYEQLEFTDYLLEEANLTERQRKIAEYVLEFNQDINFSKIARVINCSRQTVKREIEALAPILKEWMRRKQEGGEGEWHSRE